MNKIDYQIFFRHLIDLLIKSKVPAMSDSVNVLKDIVGTCPKSVVAWNTYCRKLLPTVTCDQCNGSGTVWVNKEMTTYDNCKHCNGVGALFKQHLVDKED